jgi:hypothetical protein
MQKALISGTALTVPFVYVARDVMILMRANPLRGPLEGVGSCDGYARFARIKSERHIEKQVYS